MRISDWCSYVCSSDLRAADVGDDDGAPARAMDAEPGPARLQIAPGDEAAAVVPLVQRCGGARVKLVAVADKDERPVGVDAMGEGDDTHAAHIGVARVVAKCVTDRESGRAHV